MIVRRAIVALPLALFVAVVAHMVGFGVDHAPGGGHTAMLLGSVIAAILAFLGGAFGAGFFGGARRQSIATKASSRYGLLVLAFGSALAFLSIEFAEGHTGFTLGTIRALIALLPIALVFAYVARRAEATASLIGRRAARAIAVVSATASSYTRRFSSGESAGVTSLRAHATRGRAPPLHA